MNILKRFKESNVMEMRRQLSVVVVVVVFAVLLELTLAQTQAPQELVYLSGAGSITSQSDFNPRGELTFQFRTCLGGELFSQRYSTNAVVTVRVDGASGEVVVRWSNETFTYETTVGQGFNVNLWTLVDFSFVGESLVLRVKDEIVEVANPTYNPFFFDTGVADPLVVGDGFTGCLEEVQNMGFASASDYVNVTWGVCPLDTDIGCGPQSPCASQPCLNNGLCTSSGTGFRCQCPTRYDGATCDNDLGSLCSNAGTCSNSGSCTEDGISNGTLCSCNEGRGGSECELNSTACDNNPCLNGGTCQTIDGTTTICYCAAGYTGAECTVDVDDCEVNPCLNGGVCVDGVNQFTCDCPSGYSGTRCESDSNECSSTTPCQNAICSNTNGGFFCNCTGGYIGVTCDQDLCSLDPCQNGATCSSNEGIVTCTCAAGFTDERCGTNIDDCDPNPCQNGGMCEDLVDGFTCFCRQGFIGPTCEIPLDECSQLNMCQNGATCVDEDNGHSCMCVPGYEGDLCETEIDECLSSPCANNATCDDLINAYSCNCAAGYNGTNCEQNINECASNPCQNGGSCMDDIARFTCDCTDTGFEGELCTVNIDDCASDPCQNGATCLDGVKFYNCSCYDGYSGVNCETDILECASIPCQNGGTCLELSNQDLYQPGHPYGDYVPDVFRYANASGYACVCEAGFEGSDCEININECASNPCFNLATCNDGVDGYNCTCLNGYEGVHCETDINECASNPCQNGASCSDLVGGFYCFCAEGFGNTQCDVRLTGCDNNDQCQNGATCQAFYSGGQQRFSCACAPGYYNDFCTLESTSSFRGDEDGGQYMSYAFPDTDPFNFIFSFATTFPDGHLLTSTVFGDAVTVGIRGGSLFFSILERSFENITEIGGLGSDLDDGEWHTVTITMYTFPVEDVLTFYASMSITSDSCNNNLCVGEVTILDLEPSQFPGVFFGNSYPGLPASLANEPFTGCMRDVLVPDNGDFIVIPSGSSTATAGCERTPQCSPDPCNGQGTCTDLWWTYSCQCQLGYTGPNCDTSFVQGTFSFEDSTSYAMFDISSYPVSILENTVRLIFRTREPTGLIFYTNSGVGDYISLMVDNGTLVAEANFGDSLGTIEIPEDVSDGSYHSLEFVHQGTSLSLSLDASTPEVTTLQTSSDPLFDQIFVGGVPDFNSAIHPISVQSSGHFKGCLWDVKYNNYSLEFFPLDIPGFQINSIPITTNSSVISMCNSDNTCDPEPCENDGVCSITWNDFECDCPNGYGGKNCSEETICAMNPCPGEAFCQDRGEGYECLASATFNGYSSFIKYNNSLNITQDITTISLRMRTRRENSMLLHASNMVLGYFITVSVYASGLRVDYDFGSQSRKRAASAPDMMFSQVTVADGVWHEVVITIASPESMVSVDGTNVTWATNFLGGLQDVLSNGAFVYLAYTDFSNDNFFYVYTPYEGNLDDVRIGTFLLPFFNQSVYNASNPEQFYAVQISGVTIGSDGPDVCASQPCLNGANCTDVWDAYSCSCLAGYQGDNCGDDIDECASNPCQNDSPCFDMVDAFNCSCSPGFEGSDCSVNIDECESSPCQSGGTCSDEINGFMCACDSQFTGRMCEFNISGSCAGDPCLNGGTCTDKASPSPEEEPFTCSCLEGYEGTRCAYLTDYCAPVTCQNGATCISDWAAATYRCECVAGFEGGLCETDIDDCSLGPCQNSGSCIDGVNRYSCQCVPGYSGENCEIDINECASTPCISGTCNDLTNGFSCICAEGFEGHLCEINVDECASDPCQNGGTCSDQILSYDCICPVEAVGSNCENTPCSPNPCQNEGLCSAVAPDQVSCSCSLGYTGPLCGVARCSPDPCLNGGQCSLDQQGTHWHCSCLEYHQGTRCEFKGPCVVQDCVNGGTCFQTFEEADSSFTFECACPTGFNGTYCDNEIDWCDSNPCQQEGSNCTSDRSTFYCQCAPGYAGTTCEIKLPDCASDLCLNGATCTDLPYDYECACVPGWTDKNCETNIDECEENQCVNGGQCEDQLNGYSCNCDGTGYQGTYCEEDFPECSTGTNPCLNGGTCVELTGSFECQCAAGYLGALCDIMDPCFEGVPCRNGGTCILLDETVPTFECECPSGYSGTTCETINGGPDWIIIGACIGGGVLLIIAIIVLSCCVSSVRKKRATQGSYSPSRQEMTGSFVEMDNVLKMPPEERLI